VVTNYRVVCLNKKRFSVIAILLVLFLVSSVSAYSSLLISSAASPTDPLVSYLFESPGSLPVYEVDSLDSEDPYMILDGLVKDFNERYGRDLSNPEIVFIDANNGKYFDGVIYIPENSANTEYTIAHETCHYFQDEVAHFEAFGESFCEVFAYANRSKGECSENGWPEYYCTPFRLSEVNRQGFVDCVFEDISYGGATRDELLGCYRKNAKE
jgi:hypothetical protein